MRNSIPRITTLTHTAYKYCQFPETATKAAAMHDHIVKLTKKQHFTQEDLRGPLWYIRNLSNAFFDCKDSGVGTVSKVGVLPELSVDDGCIPLELLELFNYNILFLKMKVCG